MFASQGDDPKLDLDRIGTLKDLLDKNTACTWKGQLARSHEIDSVDTETDKRGAAKERSAKNDYQKGSKYKRRVRQRLASVPKIYSKKKRKRIASAAKMGSVCTARSKRISSEDCDSNGNPHKRTKVTFSASNLPVFHSSLMRSGDLGSMVGKENITPDLYPTDYIYSKPKIDDNDEKIIQLSDHVQLPFQTDNTTPIGDERDAKPPTRKSSSSSSLKHSIGHTDLSSVKQSFVSYGSKEADDDPFARTTHPEKGVQGEMELKPRQSRKPTKETSVIQHTGDQVNQYTILEEVGRGAFGAVHKCLSAKDNKHYAMKILSRKRLIRKSGLVARHPRNRKITNLLDSLQREIAILKKVDHPNIVRLIEVMDDPQIDNVYLVFDLVERGPVIDIPADEGLHEEVAKQYFRDTVLGIEYLHYSKIIHRDIKPSNILLAENDIIKIADFGVSNMFEDEDDLMNKFEGSPAFQAPETINEHPNKYSGKAADIWALGISLYVFIYGKCPFFSTDIMLLFHRIKSAPVPFTDGVYINPQLQDLISRMLAKDPSKRITLDEIKVHPWLTSGGSKPLPSTYENCTLIEVTEEEVKNSVTLVSRLTSLVTVKSMLRKRTFSRSKSKVKSTHSV